MKLSSSRVPHLARAIAERKKQLSVEYTWTRPAHRLDLVRQQQQNGIRLLTLTARALKQQATSTPPSPPSRRPQPPNPPLRDPVQPSAVPPKPPKVVSQHDRPRPPPLITPSDDASKRHDQPKDQKRKQKYLIYLSCFGILLGSYISYTIVKARTSLRNYNASSKKLQQDADVSDRWCDAKRNFDYEVDSQEKVMWMKKKRRRLIREAYGDVLEVSVGTGRNMEQYDTRPYSAAEDSSYGRSTRHMITSLTFNDQSPVMVDRAQKKWKADQMRRRKDDRFTGEVNFVTGDAGVRGVIPRPVGGYDTIVQSMGVCSMADPVQFLRHLGRLVRQPGEHVQNNSPQKFRKQEEEDGMGGRIFLLEHGRASDWCTWLNWYLDESAPMHADRYGCWYNKDIDKIIHDSGLVVERIKRYHFGTTWEIVLRPAPGPLPGEQVKTNEGENSGQVTKKGQNWWSSLWK